MAHFRDNQDHVAIKKQRGMQPGLRDSQLGAIYSLLSHFTVKDEPGIVTMPTGSGKTAVMMVLPYLIEARRVLLLTPSQVVRGQTADDYRKLETLHGLGLAENIVGTPKVLELKHRVATVDAWRQLEDNDVIVATPYVLSPALTDQAFAPPPADMFDVIIVDEAHHTPAVAWAAILAHFAASKRALFTATPFRRDKKEIPGRVVYSYPIRRARADGIFGAIQYVPVQPQEGDDPDEAIARKVEQVYREDQHAGLSHKIMVRTDSVSRAKELAIKYAGCTQLRLEQIHSSHSFKHAKRVLQRLAQGELDGIICVDMLGEGFNLPTLKIASIHSPHKSLAVTLQFIGRFARTAGVHLGTAKFIAVPSEIEIESQRLYDEGAVWEEMVLNLSDTRVDQEIQVREDLQSFSIEEKVPDTEELSLYSLTPHFHVKVYQASVTDVHRRIDFPRPLQVVHREVSDELKAVVVVTREQTKPDWSKLERFSTVTYDLFILYHHTETGLLFICASRRTEGLYEAIAKSFCDGQPRRLPVSKLNKVLLELVDPDFFSVGMRNRVQSNTAESYRMIAGSKAQKGISSSDVRFFHQGHVYCRATEDGKNITIGVSGGSKIWSAESATIPMLVRWCERQAKKLASAAVPRTGSELDRMAMEHEVAAIPPGVISVDWDVDAYLYPQHVQYRVADGDQIRKRLLTDFDLCIDHVNTTDDSIRITLVSDDRSYSVDFRLDRENFFEPADAGEQPLIEDGTELLTFTRYLNITWPTFFFANMATLRGNFMLEFAPTEPFRSEDIIPYDWRAVGVDPEKEFYEPGEPRHGLSIHDFLLHQLSLDDLDVVIYDHGTGEIADFVTIKQFATAQRIVFTFYHCKGSGGPKPGNRVGDVYEVCGQAVKSAIWRFNSDKLLKKLLHRLRHRGSTFVRGSEELLQRIFSNYRTYELSFGVIVVQPGISQSDLEYKIAYPLAAAGEYLTAQRFESLVVIGSI